jgi:hypothetical protein
MRGRLYASFVLWYYALWIHNLCGKVILILGGHLRHGRSAGVGSTQPSCASCRPSTASSPPSADRPTHQRITSCHRRRAATHFSPPASWPFPKSRKKAAKPLEIRQHHQTTSSARTVAEDDVPSTWRRTLLVQLQEHRPPAIAGGQSAPLSPGGASALE